MSEETNTHARVGPRYPHLVVLVGATGDLARRKLLPGLFHLSSAGFIPGCRIVGVSLDDLDAEGFRKVARGALAEFCTRPVTDADWDTFAASLDYVPLTAGVGALKAAAEKAERSFAGESRRLHYLSVPPSAALQVVRMLGEAQLVERSRIILGWSTYPWLPDWDACSTRNVLPPFDQIRISASCPSGTFDNACWT